MASVYTLGYGKSVSGMANALNTYLRDEQHMETQLLHLENGDYLVQGRVSGGKYKQWIGLDKVISVTIKPVGDSNAVLEIGKGKWIDKGLVMAVSMFVLWPLTVTSGIGMYKQSKLPQKIQQVVEDYLAE